MTNLRYVCYPNIAVTCHSTCIPHLFIAAMDHASRVDNFTFPPFALSLSGDLEHEHDAAALLHNDSKLVLEMSTNVEIDWRNVCP